MKHQDPSQTRGSFSWWWICGIVAIIALGAATYFIYVYLPKQIATSIVNRSKTRAQVRWTPQDDGFKYKDVSFKDADGISILGWWMPSRSKKPLGTVLMTHGLFKSREQMLSRAEFLVTAGYQVLLFDQRGEGLSGDSPVSGGFLEAGDFLAGVEFLKKEHHLTKPLFFMGFSMGAISAIRSAAQCPDVDGVVADSPLPNGKSYVSRRTLGGVFTSLPGFLDQCLADYDFLTGLSLTTDDLDLSKVVVHFNDIPVLYITGEADDLARSTEVKDLFNLTQTHHRSLVYVPNAGHEQTYSTDPEAYEQAVLKFMEAVRDHFPEPDQDELMKKAKIIIVPEKKSAVRIVEDIFKKRPTATR